MDNPIKPPDTRSDEELMQEYEDTLTSSADDINLRAEKKVLH